MKLFILSHTLVLIKKIKGNKETSLVYFYYQSSNMNCQKGNSYCEIAQLSGPNTIVWACMNGWSKDYQFPHKLYNPREFIYITGLD